MAEARKIGIKVPILPGIMPIRSFGMFGRMTSFCKTVIPDELQNKLNELKDDNKELMLYGLKYITDMLNDIKKANIVPGFHIYTMNLEYSTIALLKLNGLGDKDMIEKEYLKSHEQQEEKWKAQKLKKQTKRERKRKGEREGKREREGKGERERARKS